MTKRKRLSEMAAVEVKGVKQLRSALRKFEPNLSKELTAEMRKELAPIVREAKGYIPSSSPLSNWRARSFSEARFPFFNASLMKSGIGYKASPSKPNRNGFQSYAKIYNKSAAGAIYETAGRKNPQGQKWVGSKAGGSGKGVSRSVNPDAGREFISRLGALYGDRNDRGRAIYRAYANNRGAAKVAILKAIKTAEHKFNTSTRKAA